MNSTPATPETPSADWSLPQWLRWQEGLNPRGIALGLERVREVAGRLGLPDAGIRTLAVAGTNGKGSSATLAALIYREAGYRTGLYTSPHLLHYRERVTIDGRPATDAELCRAFQAIEQARGAVPLTYFEYGTLAALWLFREAGAQVQVLEVGLGGRLDAVNLVDADAALITNIGLDHTDWLGKDRESIAREKAGVMRAGRPAIYVEADMPEAIEDVAEALKADLRQVGGDFYFVTEASGAWHWREEGTAYQDLPAPALKGAMQYRNAAGVLAAVDSLKAVLPVPEGAIRAALGKLSLPGRFQRIGPVILDVAHNAEAAQVLADNLQALGEGPVTLVLGMLSDKPVETVCAALAPHVARAFCGGLPGPRGIDGATLAARAQAGGLKAQACDDIPTAFARARQAAGDKGLIVVCGSFLTVAAIAENLAAISNG